VDVDPDQATYTIGTVVTLTATDDPGWTFAGWSGDAGGGANPLAVTMDASKVITATFSQEMTGTLAGQVTTEFHAAAGFPVTVKLVDMVVRQVVLTETVTLDASGAFTITDVLAGTYDVWVKNSHTLAQREDDVVIGGGEIADREWEDVLWEGDANDDNKINTTDFSLWLLLFGSGDVRADFNLDGLVNTTDFSIWYTNFTKGVTGDPVTD
jgi:uncharacterized repeat protein (TIGR02543 family)